MKYEIIRLAKGGFGISNLTGKTFFVEGALPGETGEAEILEEKPRYGRCRATTFDTLSSARNQNETCPLSSKCDGCGFRHVVQSESLRLKAQAIYAEIVKNAHIDDMPYELIAVSQFDSSRRRVRIHADHGKLGFYARNSHTIIPASSCRIIAPELRRAIVWLETNLKLPEYARLDIQIDLDEQNRAFAHIKQVEARILKKDQHRPGMRRPRPQNEPVFALTKLRSLAQNAVQNQVFCGIRLDSEVFGEAMIRDVIEPNGLPQIVTYRRNGDFAQATREANEHIHRIVAEFIEQTKPQFVADLFCGSGNLTFRAAQGNTVKRVTGCEFFCDREAFERGRNENSCRFGNDCEVRLVEADLSKGLPKAARDVDVMISDPARDGMSENLIQDICATRAEHLLYVSCEASCLARDIPRLSEAFSLDRLLFVDMFPMTPHVETIACFSRKH